MATNMPVRAGGPTLRGVCLGAVLSISLAAASCAAAQPLGFEEALALAERHSPALEARRAGVSAASAQWASAGRLPDPQLALGIDNLPVSGADRFRWNAEPMTMRRIALMQDMPNLGKREAQREAAQALVERERALFSSEQLAVRRGAAMAWVDLHYAQRRLQEFEQAERENRLLRDTMDARVARGAALPAEALMARQEALALAEQRDELEAALSSAAAALARWTGIPAPTAATTAPALGVDAAGLIEKLDRHAELLAYEPMLLMAHAEVRDAQAGKRGDWGWEVAYSNRARTYGDMVSFQVRLDLPLWQKTRQEPQLAARQREAERVQAEREDARRRVRAELLARSAELQQLERAVTRQQQDALPLARQRTSLTLASYEAGRSDLASVLSARRDEVQARLRALELEASLMRLRAQLSHLIAE